MLTFLIVVGCLICYMAMGTFLAIKSYWVFNKNPRTDAKFLSGVTAFLWPFGVWFLIAEIFIQRGTADRAQAAKLNTEREVLLAQARKELADLQHLPIVPPEPRTVYPSCPNCNWKLEYQGGD